MQNLYKVPDNRIFYVCIDCWEESTDFSGRIYASCNFSCREFFTKREIPYLLEMLIDVNQDVPEDYSFPAEIFKVRKAMKLYVVEVLWQQRGELQGRVSGVAKNEDGYFKNRRELLEILTRNTKQQLDRKNVKMRNRVGTTISI